MTVTDVTIASGDVPLPGSYSGPSGRDAVVVFAHGSGSSRLSPRNVEVAGALQARGFGTLLFDLLTEHESRDRGNVFDIGLLSRRLLAAVAWTDAHVQGASIGLFGASTGAAAALVAAAERRDVVCAVVSRGGRPDLAAGALARVMAPTLLIVGGRDPTVLELNRDARARMTASRSDLKIVPGATHLFDEAGALERVAELAAGWFERYVPPTRTGRDRDWAGA